MMIHCGECTTPFYDAARCPHCGSTRRHEASDPCSICEALHMAKATVHGGPTNANDPTPEPEPVTLAGGGGAGHDATIVTSSTAEPGAEGTGTDDTGHAAPTVSSVPRPPQSASVGTWAAYLEHLGVSTDGLTKADMIAAADAIETEA